MIQSICQWLLISVLAFLFLGMVRMDFDGIPERKAPAGYRGFVGSVIALVFLTVILYGAGAFSRLSFQ